MKTGTVRLLEKGLELSRSKYALAKALGMNASNLNKALKGQLHLGARPAVLLAELLDMEAMDVLAVTQADAARTPQERDWWLSKVPRFLRTLALGIALSTGFPNGGPAPAGAEPIYIMRTKRRRAA